MYPKFKYGVALIARMENYIFILWLPWARKYLSLTPEIEKTIIH
jgi:hypothetical protein